MKDKKSITIVAGKEGLEFYKAMKKQSKFLTKHFKPSADWDSTYDFIYIAFNGGRGVKYSAEATTKEGNNIVFDFDNKDNIVGVEIEGLTYKKIAELENKIKKLEEKLARKK